MNQIIAVHAEGTMPRVMELDLSSLDPVQAHAFKHLPRTASGVPELRGLSKKDGEVVFKFKVPPSQFSAHCLPELLTLWDAKFTDATLKVIAKQGKAERAAASAAGLWKDGTEKGDVTTALDKATPAEERDYSEALATVKQKKKATAQPKRIAKPKELQAVIAATTDIDPLTGERTAKVSTFDTVVAGINAKSLTERMLATAAQGQSYADPLENARLNDPTVSVSSDASSDASTTGESPVPTMAVQSDSHLPPPGENCSTPLTKEVQTESTVDSTAANDKAKQAIEQHKQGKRQSKSAQLIEMGPEDLFAFLDRAKAEATPCGVTNMAKTIQACQNIDSATHASEQTVGGQDKQPLSAPAQAISSGDDQTGQSGFAAYEDSEQYEPLDEASVRAMFASAGHEDTQDSGSVPSTWVANDTATAQTDAATNPVAQYPAAVQTHNANTEQGQPVQEQVQEPSELDWTSLHSFRLANHLTCAQQVILPTSEIFEALAHISMQEPLGVQVDWLQDAAQQSGAKLTDQAYFEFASGWLRDQLAWRTKELMRWLGKGDLVTPEILLKDQIGKKTGKRPAGWVNTAVEMAGMAQQISMDIAMQELTIAEVERSLTGMPAWAIDTIDQIRNFTVDQAAQEQIEGNDTQAKVSRNANVRVSAEFRESWRAELMRIDDWCNRFKTIKIARQIGLFGSSADQKMLIRLEALIERAKAWQGAPAQASRVLSVWLGFVLSLDHSAVPCHPALKTTKESSHA